MKDKYGFFSLKIETREEWYEKHAYYVYVMKKPS